MNSQIEIESNESIATTPSLIDSPSVEIQLADDLRANFENDCESFDPLGLYTLEMECDAASTILADRFSNRAVSIQFTRTAVCIDRLWSTRSQWDAMIHDATPEGHISATGDSPFAAVEAVSEAYAKAIAPVRTTPEHRRLSASMFETFGRIDPATKAAFLSLVEQHHGRSDFLEVLSDGRVLLAKGEIEGSEAQAIGGYVAQHLLNGSQATATAKIVIEQAGDTFKSYVVLPSGERVKAGNCATAIDARSMAAAAILAMRSTVFTKNPIAANGSTAA